MDVLSGLLRSEVPLLSLLVSLGITASGIVLAVIVGRVMRWLAERTRRSRFQMDGILVRVTARPLSILVGAMAVLYALRRIEPVGWYLEQFPGVDRALVILIGSWVAGSLVRELVNVYGRPYVESTETDFDERLLGLADLTAAYVIYVLGLLAALHSLGIQITGFIASLGIVGLAAALAARTVLSNLFGGLMLTVDPYLQVGHRVRVGEWVGDVEKISLHKTTLRTRDNLLVSIPNDVLMHETTVNYVLPESRTRVELDVSIAYESDLDRATELLREIAREVEAVEPEPEPEVNVKQLGDHGVVLSVLVWQVEPRGRRRTRDRIYRRVLERFAEEGIDIPYPHLDVSFRRTSASPLASASSHPAPDRRPSSPGDG